MPSVIPMPVRRFAAAAGACALLLTIAPSALAAPGGPAPTGPLAGPPAPVPVAPAQPSTPTAVCPTVSSSQVLSGLSDSAYYAPLSGGTFEGATTGWTFSNAQVVAGNEPWYVDGASDSHALLIKSDGQAISPSFCLDNTFPTWRLFAQVASGGGPAAALNVSVQWVDAAGDTGSVPVTTLPAAGYSAWTLSPSFTLGSALADGQTVTAHLVISTRPGGSWLIDDVLLDPYAK